MGGARIFVQIPISPIKGTWSKLITLLRLITARSNNISQILINTRNHNREPSLITCDKRDLQIGNCTSRFWSLFSHRIAEKRKVYNKKCMAKMAISVRSFNVGYWYLTKGLTLKIDQFRYIKTQPKTIDLSTRLLGINTEFVGFFSQEPRTEVYCFRLNFNISKFVYWCLSSIQGNFKNIRKTIFF